MTSQHFRNKKTGEIVTQFSILDIKNLEQVYPYTITDEVGAKVFYATREEVAQAVQRGKDAQAFVGGFLEERNAQHLKEAERAYNNK